MVRNLALVMSAMAPSLSYSMQRRKSKGALASFSDANNSEETPQMWKVTLDKGEVAERGSHCLDGSAPEYFHYNGREEDKWIFHTKCPNGMCSSEEECYGKLPVTKDESADVPDVEKRFRSHGFNLVYMVSCDFGLFMGDRAAPVEYKGTKLYYQGARIIKHVIDDLLKRHTMREVFFISGSGGGQSLYVGANYLHSLMPKTVEKFAVAPINGWYAPGPAKDFKHMFEEMRMEGQMNQKCATEMGEGKVHHCLDPHATYDSVECPMFVTQVFDDTWKPYYDDDLGAAWDSCLDQAATGQCKKGQLDSLQSYFDDFVATLQSKEKSQRPGVSGYISTCSEHVFYKSDHYSSYKSDGVSVDEAVWNWWSSLDNNPSQKWYLPCKLNDPKHPQCEKSCRDHVKE